MVYRKPDYTHPKWQKKRLTILSRDNFTCQDCCDESGKTLHVHHSYYVKNREIWDYPDWSLNTLCEDCHKKAHPAIAEDEDSTCDIWEEALEFFAGPVDWQDGFFDIGVAFARACQGIRRDEVIVSVLHHLEDLRKTAHV